MKKFKVITVFSALLIFTAVLSTQVTHARKAVDGTEGKACPDFNNDNCCEAGSGNCLETVIIVAK